MKRALITSNVRDVQKSLRNLKTNPISTEIKMHTNEIVQSHTSRGKKGVRETYELKNNEFVKVPMFDETEEIDILETGKQDMSNLLSKLEKTIRDQGQDKKDNKPIVDVEYVATVSSKNVVTAKDAAKIEKLLRKYKELKTKLKSKDWETFKSEQEKADLRKHIEAKDELIKMKDVEIVDLGNTFKNEHSKRNTLEEEMDKLKSENDLKAKDKEYRKLRKKMMT